MERERQKEKQKEKLKDKQKEGEGRGVLTLDKEMSRIRAVSNFWQVKKQNLANRSLIYSGFQGFERYIKLLGEVVTRYNEKIASKNRANRRVDKAITDMNVEVNELQFGRDLEQEKTRKESQHRR